MQYNWSFSYPLYVLSAKSSFKIIKLFPALITFCLFLVFSLPSIFPALQNIHNMHVHPSRATNWSRLSLLSKPTASKLSYLGEWTESRENARASGEASLAQIGGLARRLVETRLPIIAYTGRDKLTFKFKLQTTANEYAAERRISRRLDQEKYTLIRHIDQLFSFQCVYTGRLLIRALKFVGTSFTDKRKVHRSANVRKMSWSSFKRVHFSEVPFVRHRSGVRFRRTNPQEAIYELFWDKFNSLFLLSVRV